jgi:hypothetical protein
MDFYRYEFGPTIPMDEVEASLVLAIFSAESLYGESRVRLETSHAFSSATRSCIIKPTGEVGRDLNRLFLGFISREFGQDAFDVERIAACERAPAAPAA